MTIKCQFSVFVYGRMGLAFLNLVMVYSLLCLFIMYTLVSFDRWLGQRLHIDHDVVQFMHRKSDAHLNWILDEHANFTDVLLQVMQRAAFTFT